MTIKEVCEKYNISQDTLRYYEKAGMIQSRMLSRGRENGKTRVG